MNKVLNKTGILLKKDPKDIKFELTLMNDLTPLKSGEAIVAAPVAFHSFLAGLVS